MNNSTLSIAKKGEKYTAAEMIEALKATRGMVSLAAKRLGCAPDTVYRYIREYPTVAAAKWAEREAVTDVAELSLYKAIQDGEGWAVCFYLKTQGKERGYVERHELSGPNGGPITVREVVIEVPSETIEGNGDA